MLDRFRREVDPDSLLPPAERERRAERLRHAHMLATQQAFCREAPEGQKVSPRQQGSGEGSVADKDGQPSPSVHRRIDWPVVLDRAAQIVRSYDTGVTLRQLFYRLVSEGAFPNTIGSYKRLSELTAAARREGSFPYLIDRGRSIYRPSSWASAKEILTGAASQFRFDRTRDQDTSVYLAVEKASLVVQLVSWFGDLGLPVLALGGYASQSYVDVVVADVDRQERPAALLYAGDLDPSGEDIDRDFLERTDCWHKVVRVALTPEQVDEFNLPAMPGKATDSRAAGFIARHGALTQTEVDALPPNVLRSLFADAVSQFWDTSRYDDVVADEQAERDNLVEIAEQLADDQEPER